MALPHDNSDSSRLALRPALTLAGFWCGLTIAILAVRFGLAANWPVPLSSPLPLWTVVLGTGLVMAAWFVLGSGNGHVSSREFEPKRTQHVANLCIIAAMAVSIVQVGWLWRCNLVFNAGPYARPSLAYLSSVTERLTNRLTGLRDPSLELTSEQRELVEQLEASLSDWTANVVVGNLATDRLAGSFDMPFRLGSLQTLAQDVYPLAGRQAEVAAYLRKEAEVIASELPATRELRQELKQREVELSAAFDSLSEDTEHQHENRIAIAQLAAELTLLESLGQTTDRAIASMVARQEFRAAHALETSGLNAKYPWLRLPVCLPGGACWSYSAAISWSAWGVFLLASLLVSHFWQPRQANDQRYKIGVLRSGWLSAGLASLGSCLLL